VAAYLLVSKLILTFVPAGRNSTSRICEQQCLALAWKMSLRQGPEVSVMSKVPEVSVRPDMIAVGPDMIAVRKLYLRL
jgi:hypothetical protein